MLTELKRMKWNEKVAVILGFIGGVLGIFGALITIASVDYLEISGSMLMGALILVYTGIAFLPPPQQILLHRLGNRKYE
jgi:hypothetical protein